MKPKGKEMMPLRSWGKKQTSTLILPENIYFKNTVFKQKPRELITVTSALKEILLVEFIGQRENSPKGIRLAGRNEEQQEG